MRALFITAIIAAPCLAEELPNPQLLPTTKAIHEKIAAKADPKPEEMKGYAESVLLAEGGSIELVPIPAGKFKIGSPDGEAKRGADESPQQEIAIEPFWMAKVETTWDLYRPYMENGKSRNKDGTLNRDADMSTSEAPVVKDGETLIDTISQPTPPYIPMHFSMGDGYSKEYPAVGITHHAANKFCEWLSAQTGHFYRLPTEAEWEYACRAGTTTPWHCGGDAAHLQDFGWFADTSDETTHPVGQKQPNAWGLYDMHGNVWEWCSDWYGEYPKGAVSDPRGPKEGSRRVVRGGGWCYEAADCRSAYRYGLDPSRHSFYFGFRVALNCEFDITAKARSSPSIRARQEVPGVDQTIPENQRSGLFDLPRPPLIGGLRQHPRLAASVSEL